MIAARNAGEAARAASEIREAGLSAEGHRLDVTDPTAARECFAARGPFDILANSAGMARHGPALETAPENFDAVAEVNIRAACFPAQEAAKGMAGGAP